MLKYFLNYFRSMSDFVPKSFVCFKEGYNLEIIRNDILAGITVGIIALPLAMAFAIGSGVPPERGLFTAIVAGFLISLLGGSRVQIGGPTGAFVVIVYATVQRHGYDGLVIATILAGIMMMLFGLARAGVLLKFIPYPVTTGFTTGIAVVIFSSQIKDFFGLDIETVPADFSEKWLLYFKHASSWDIWPLGLGLCCLGIIFGLRYTYPKIPGAIIAVIFATIVTWVFDFPVETIATKFGEIPRMLPDPVLPAVDWDKIQAVFPDAVTIALLGAIESLLSAVVADGMTGQKHRSNCELVAQGFANISSALFGGIPATGAIARTTANIKMGAKTPLAGMVHAVTLLLLMLAFAPLAAEIPLAALAAVLIFVAWNMSELEHFIAIVKGPKSDALILVITFGLTVFIDLTVAVQIGVILAAVMFLKKMTDATTVEVCKILLDENAHESAGQVESDLVFRRDVPEGTLIFEINGPFFYSVTDSLNELLRQCMEPPQILIIRMRKVPLIDASGIHALKEFSKKCKEQGILLLLSGAREEIGEILRKNDVIKAIGEDNVFTHLHFALYYARTKSQPKHKQQSTFNKTLLA